MQFGLFGGPGRADGEDGDRRGYHGVAALLLVDGPRERAAPPAAAAQSARR